MAEQLKTYSVLINWCDGDREQGEYGWVGKAKDYTDAEDKARRAMFEDDQLVDDDDDREEYDSENPPYGSVLDCSEGAIWKAWELEDALRLLVNAQTAEDDTAARERANKVLAEIDAM